VRADGNCLLRALHFTLESNEDEYDNKFERHNRHYVKFSLAADVIDKERSTESCSKVV
jgi:hypothetical protein